MRRFALSVCLMLFATTALGACGAETAPPAPGGGGTGLTPGTGGIGTGGTPGTGGTGAAGGGGGSSGAGGDGGMGGTASTGACDNPSDLTILADLADPSEARRISAACGATICSGSVDPQQCITDATACIGRDIPGLSVECATCYGELAFCAEDLCNTQCALNPCGSCLTCDSGSYAACQEQLGNCAGDLPAECAPS